MKKTVLFLFLVLLSSQAFSKSFFILKLEDDKVYIDITKDDIISSKILNVFSKPEFIEHPVTKKQIEVTKKLGVISLLEVKDSYAVAAVPAGLKDKIEIGQKVEFISNEPVETAALAFGEEVAREMGKNRNSLSFGGNFNRIASSDYFFGAELNYGYNFLLTYLYSIQIGMGYIQGEYNLEKPKFIYARPILEWRLGDYFSVITGMRVGMKKEGIGYGVEGGIRIGKPFKTNILLGGSTLEDFGKAGYLILNGRVTDTWLSLTIQVDSFPVNINKETFRTRFGVKTPISDSGSNIYGGVILSGRNTSTVGFGVDFGTEIKF